VSFNEKLSAVEVYDLSGKLVKSVNGNATEMNVSVENLEAGVYTVVVRSAKGDFSKKLIIE
jgi:myo-inositol-hexaphosphate 3-phosphohydrolase